jgi:hypothetical protein
VQKKHFPRATENANSRILPWEYIDTNNFCHATGECVATLLIGHDWAVRTEYLRNLKKVSRKGVFLIPINSLLMDKNRPTYK